LTHISGQWQGKVKTRAPTLNSARTDSTAVDRDDSPTNRQSKAGAARAAFVAPALKFVEESIDIAWRQAGSVVFDDNPQKGCSKTAEILISDPAGVYLIMFSSKLTNIWSTNELSTCTADNSVRI
jgi:hypothetical protein